MARLRKTFGDGLVALLDQADIEKLGRVLDNRSAGNLVQRWRENAKEASVVAFLDAHRVDARLASKVLRYWPAYGRVCYRSRIGWPAAALLRWAASIKAKISSVSELGTGGTPVWKNSAIFLISSA